VARPGITMNHSSAEIHNPMRKTFVIIVLNCFLVIAANAGAPAHTVTSPDGNIIVRVNTKGKITYTVSYKEKLVLSPSEISLTLGNGKVLGNGDIVSDQSLRAVNEEVRPLYGMASSYKNNFNELRLRFKNNFSVFFRVYNNGVAYRFVTSFPGKIKVKEEQVSYQFDSDVTAWMQKVNSFLNSYEEHYVNDKISYLDSGKIAVLPLLAESNGIKIAITESDLLDYAGLYLSYNNSFGLKGALPPFVLNDSTGGCCPNFEKIVTKTAPYIAETNGTRNFPWRLMILAEHDKDLLYNNLVFLLASENKIGDASWVKPGKVLWDWWSSNNLKGVDFKTGFNTQTYKYYIDFAATNGIEYINLDEGWSDQYDLLKINDGTLKHGNNTFLAGGLDMPYLLNYAREKGVGIILWCVWHTLDRQMPEALDQFQKWGIKGLKVDFMDRDDQTVVNFYERLARETAKRKMILNFHGAFKPTGLERTYPNAINREAVQGLEYNKFSDKCTPDHAVNIAFIRMLAGSMDYTPGGLFNSNQQDFKVSLNRPMTQGTRCHQLAMFTMYYAPLEMVSDSPSDYLKEPETLDHIVSMPTIWDETIPIDGEVGEYAIIARRKGNIWHVAGLTNWTGRIVAIKFDFLTSTKYKAILFTDGRNANRIGNDYISQTKEIFKGDLLEIEMANGGGFTMKLEPLN
jgi:alpha-glucosidase